MTGLQTAIVHLIGFLAALGTIAALAVTHTLSPETTQTLLVGVLIAGGFYVGANVGGSSSPPPSPAPVPPAPAPPSSPGG